MSDTKSDTHSPELRRLGAADASSSSTPADSNSSGLATHLPATNSSDHPAQASGEFDERQETVISKKPPTPQIDEPRPFSPIEMGVALQGQQLEHFQLEKFVGGGGMGAVFRARDLTLDRVVAVKVLSRDHADPDIHRRFRNEAQSAARLDHDNISRVFYVGQDKGWNYIVFEFVDGMNVRDVVSERGPLPVAEAISYVMQVAEALEHAYRRDVVHRDIKPSNLLITPSGQIKLVDMGLARLHQVETPGSDLTASGVTLGTFDYISPEQARDPRLADVRSDLYSLGCTFYFMLTGRPPFPEGTVLQKLLSHTSDERPDPRLYRPDLPEEIAEILNRLLARRPEERHQQPSELIGELLLASEQLGLASDGPSGRVWVTRSAKQPSWVERLTPIVLPLVLLLLAVWGLERFFGGVEEDPVGQRQRYLKSDTSAQPGISNPEAPSTGDDDKPPSDTRSSVTESSRAPVNSVDDRGPNRESDQEQVLPPTDQDVIVDSKPSDNEGDANDVGVVVADLAPAVDDSDSAAGIGLPDSEASLSEQAPVEASLDGSDVFTQPAEEPRPIAPADVRRIVVAQSEPSEAAADATYCGSFAQAVNSLDRFPNAEIIELQFDGPLREAPVQVTASDLTIQAGDGFRPLLSFQPSTNEPAAGGHMIQVSGGNITWSGVQLEMNLSDEASSGGWSLFELDQIGSIELRDSSMTIRNALEDGTSRHPTVAFFRVSVPPSLKMMAVPGEPSPMPMAPVIELRRCIVRGEATLIRMPEVTPLRLSWNQGLLAINERLLEAHGAARMADRDRPIEIDLIHVTAAIPQGMCRLVGETDAQSQPRLDIECTASIFLCSSDAPFIEHTGVRDVDEVKSDWLRYRGDNFYPSLDGGLGFICWRIVPLHDPKNELVLTVNDREKPWWDGAILPQVMWHKPPTDTPIFHRHLPQDYQLVEKLSNPPIQFADEHGDAGVDVDALPSLFHGPASTGSEVTPADDDVILNGERSAD